MRYSLITVECDIVHCTRVIEVRAGPQLDAQLEIRRALSFTGWALSDERDLCPDHVVIAEWDRKEVGRA